MNRIKMLGTLAWSLIALGLSVPTLGAEATKYPLVEAAQKGDAARVKALLSQGQEPNQRDSALHAAVRGGHKEIVALLLAHGADANAIRWVNATPLMVAVTGGASADTIQGFTNSLLFLGLGRWTSVKRSPAAQQAFRDIVRLLIDHGAEVNAKEKQRGLVPLHYAIFGGDKEVVKALLDRGARPNPPVAPVHLPYSYVTPLHLAADYGDVGMCELLVDRGAEVNAEAPTEKGVWSASARQTPLHFAAYSGNTKCVEFLLDHGAQVDAGGTENETALHIAAERKNQVLVEILLSHGADANRKSHDGRTAMSIATGNGSEGIVKLLLARRSPITVHGAASVGDVDAMERLVRAGTNVNRLDNQGQTALHAATAAGHVRAVEWLIAHGANVNLPDDKEATALSIALGIAQGYYYAPDPSEAARVAALKKRQKEIIALLISHGAALDFSYGMPQKTVLSHPAEVAALLIGAGGDQDPSGDQQATLLHRAAWWGSKETVAGLLALGANVNAADRVGATPLYAALQGGCTRYTDVITRPNVEIVQLLLAHGANINAANHRKATPLHVAAEHAETVKILLARGARADAADEGGATPLHYAASQGSIEAMELLLAHGADPNATDRDGDTPLLLLLSRSALLRDEDEQPAKDFALKLIRRGARVDARNKDGVTLLQEAAALGFPDLVEEMLTRGAPVNLKSTTGWTALHSAVTNGDAGCVEMLLQHDAQVNGLGRLPDLIRLPRFNWSARTPLHIAAAQGANRLIPMLLAHGADVNTRDGDGRTALHLARENKRVETVKLLLGKGGDDSVPAVQPWIPGRPDRSPISQAQAKRDLDVVKSLASKAPAALLTNLLFQEVEDGYSELIPVLVAHGADVNAHESLRQETPLHRAVNKKNLKAIELLLVHGADINGKDKNNETPLGAAVYRGQRETVSLLLAHGADGNIAYKKECEFRGAIPLHVAVQRGYLEIAQMLVLQGASVNAVGLWDGVTPLHLALKDRALLELMLEHGGRINSCSADGSTVLHAAAQAGQEELAQYLIGKGALVNVQDRKGNTPLHLAAKNGHRTLCEILIAHKADINLRSQKGLLPLDCAQAAGVEDVFPDGRAVPTSE